MVTNSANELASYPRTTLPPETKRREPSRLTVMRPAMATAWVDSSSWRVVSTTAISPPLKSAGVRLT
jgi:hypothetical protein